LSRRWNQLTSITLEYLKSIKDHIKNGSRLQGYETNRQYIDAVEVWKMRHAQAKTRILELEHQNMRLEEKELRVRKEMTASSRQTERESSVVSTTPKRANDETPSHSAKRLKEPNEYQLGADGTQVEDVDALNNTEAGETNVVNLLKEDGKLILDFHRFNNSSTSLSHP
jgi:hypothetical protein